MSERIRIDADVAVKFNEWLAGGRGILRWVNLELGSSYPREVFTPGDGKSPGWRYGRPSAIAPIEVDVNTPTELASFRGRFKRQYWGPGVADATEKKADRLVAKYNDPLVYWTWVHDCDLPGYVKVTILRESVTPFRTPLEVG